MVSANIWDVIPLYLILSSSDGRSWRVHGRASQLSRCNGSKLIYKFQWTFLSQFCWRYSRCLIRIQFKWEPFNWNEISITQINHLFGRYGINNPSCFKNLNTVLRSCRWCRSIELGGLSETHVCRCKFNIWPSSVTYFPPNMLRWRSCLDHKPKNINFWCPY